MLQQHLPLAVLKLCKLNLNSFFDIAKLQQHLPFTVLKPATIKVVAQPHCWVATAPTVYGIETDRRNRYRC